VVLGTDPLTADQLPTEVFRLGTAEESGWLRAGRLTARSVVPYRRFKAECEREYIEAVLQRCGWSVTEASRALGLQRTYLHAKVGRARNCASWSPDGGHERRVSSELAQPSGRN